MTTYACCDHCSMRGPHEAHVSPCAATCSQGGEGAQGLREGTASETEPLLGHCPACHSPMYGPCGTCISRANAAGTPWEVQRLNAILAERDATIERLRGGREIEQTMLANVLPTLAANDAENEALRAEVASLRAFQLQPRAVPDAPTTNLLPVAPKLVVGHGAVGNTPMCHVHPEHFMPCSRCLGYGCTACDNTAKL